MYAYFFLVFFNIQTYPRLSLEVDAFFETDLLNYFETTEEKETAIECYRELMDMDDEEIKEEASEHVVNFLKEEDRVNHYFGALQLRLRFNPQHTDGVFCIKTEEDVMDRDSVQVLLTQKDHEGTLMEFLNSCRV